MREKKNKKKDFQRRESFRDSSFFRRMSPSFCWLLHYFYHLCNLRERETEIVFLSPPFLSFPWLFHLSFFWKVSLLSSFLGFAISYSARKTKNLKISRLFFIYACIRQMKLLGSIFILCNVMSFQTQQFSNFFFIYHMISPENNLKMLLAN